MKVKEESENVWQKPLQYCKVISLQLIKINGKKKPNIQKTKIMASGSPSFLSKQIGKKCKQWQILFSWAPKSLWTVTAAMKLKDICSLEESYDKPRQCIKKQRLPYDSAIPLLGIHTEETRTERDTCTPVFIAALFIIARTWKQLRCPSADEWIRKLWYIYTVEYYSVIKKNTFESVLMRRMKLEPIIQSEVSQKDKHQYSIPTHIYGI